MDAMTVECAYFYQPVRLPPINEIGASADQKKVEKVAQEFESYLIGSLLNTMFEGVPTDGLMGGGLSENIFRSLLLEEYGKAFSKAGGLGLQKHLIQAIERQQKASTLSDPTCLEASYDTSF